MFTFYFDYEVIEFYSIRVIKFFVRSNVCSLVFLSISYSLMSFVLKDIKKYK